MFSLDENNMSSKIKHSGTIEAISGDVLQVRIMQSSACAGCKVSAHCTASESKEKKIDVYGEDASLYHVGQQVTLLADRRMGMLALFYAYILPFIILLSVLVAVVSITGNEVKGALASLLSLIPYYLIVYLFRDRIKSQVYFQIEKS